MCSSWCSSKVFAPRWLILETEQACSLWASRGGQNNQLDRMNGVWPSYGFSFSLGLQILLILLSLTWHSQPTVERCEAGVMSVITWRDKLCYFDSRNSGQTLPLVYTRRKNWMVLTLCEEVLSSLAPSWTLDSLALCPVQYTLAPV